MLHFAACFAVAGGLCYFAYTNVTTAAIESQRSELVNIARLAALQVDPAAHESLTKPSQQDSPSYLSQVERLRTAIQQTTDVRFIYTIRKVGNGYRFVLDPTPAGDADGDGVDDKSYLLDPVVDAPPEVSATFESGVAHAEQAPAHDPWGTWLSAYAPIKDSTGKVVAVVGVDRDARVSGTAATRYAHALWAALAVALVGSLFLAQVLTGAGPRRATRRNGSAARRPLLEVGLIVVVGAVGTGALVDQASARQALASTRGHLDEIRRLDGARTALDQVQLFSVGWREIASQVAADLSKTSAPWIGGEFKRLTAIPPTEREARLAVSNSVSAALSEAIEQRRIELAAALETQAAASRRAGQTIILSVLLMAVSLVALRLAGKRDERAVQAQDESDSLRTRFDELLGHLPIGLFGLRDGRVAFTNAEWDRQMDRTDEEAPGDALTRALHPDDRPRVEQELAQAYRSGSVLRSQFRVVTPSGDTVHLEAAGTPVLDAFGTIKHILGFMIDITPVVAAQQELQAKNREIEINNRLLESALAEIEASLESIVRALVKAVEAKDPYTAGHSERVMQYSKWIGEELELGPYEMRILELGTLIHDIGKIGIPDAVLTKPGPLTEEEFRQVMEHPASGAEMVEGIALFRDCVPIVRWHHERQNGSGYPDGLAGDEIPYLVRISAVADVFDAMTSTRSYREGIEPEKVLEIMRREAEQGLLDPLVFAALTRVIEKNGLIPQAPTDWQHRSAA